MGIRRRLTDVNPHLRVAVEKQARFLYEHDARARGQFEQAAYGRIETPFTAPAEKGRAYASVVKDVLRNLDLM